MDNYGEINALINQRVNEALEKNNPPWTLSELKDFISGEIDRKLDKRMQDLYSPLTQYGEGGGNTQEILLRSIWEVLCSINYAIRHPENFFPKGVIRIEDAS